jgi:hypothetical protein
VHPGYPDEGVPAEVLPDLDLHPSLGRHVALTGDERADLAEMAGKVVFTKPR